MSANFLDDKGRMVGIDLHVFWTVIPAPPYVVPVPMIPHLVHADHDRLIAMGRTPTVTSDAEKMLKSGFGMYVFIHSPLTVLPPAPVEAIMLGVLLVKASSIVVMTVHSVTSQATPLGTCIYGAFGIHVNCGLPGVGAVYNANSVKTSPTAGDYAGAIAAFASRTLIPIPIVKGIIGEWAKRKVQENVDEFLDEHFGGP